MSGRLLGLCQGFIKMERVRRMVCKLGSFCVLQGCVVDCGNVIW